MCVCNVTQACVGAACQCGYVWRGARGRIRVYADARHGTHTPTLHGSKDARGRARTRGGERDAGRDDALDGGVVGQVEEQHGALQAAVLLEILWARWGVFACLFVCLFACLRACVLACLLACLLVCVCVCMCVSVVCREGGMRRHTQVVCLASFQSPFRTCTHPNHAGDSHHPTRRLPRLLEEAGGLHVPRSSHGRNHPKPPPCTHPCRPRPRPPPHMGFRV